MRLKIVLGAQGLPLRYPDVLYLTFIGYFFNHFLPTAVGGDVVKAFYISKISKQAMRSYTSVFMDRFLGNWPDAAGGPSLGADPIAGALAALSHIHGQALPSFIVRGAIKDHGLQRQVEGHLHPGDQVVLLDDVITRGGSLVRAATVVREHGAKVTHVFTILDRLAGGAEILAGEGLTLESLYLLTDIMTPEELEAVPPAPQLKHL